MIADEETLNRLFSAGNPPLGSFAARITLCRALNLIGPETCKELNTIRDIRNAFAHNLVPTTGRGTKSKENWVELTFDTSPVAGWCNKLKSYAKVKDGHLATTPRLKFIESVGWFGNRLGNYRSAKRSPPKPVPGLDA